MTNQPTTNATVDATAQRAASAASAIAAAYTAVASGHPSYADELLSVAMSAAKFADSSARQARAAAEAFQAWVESRPEGSSLAAQRVRNRWATANKAAQTAWRAELSAEAACLAWPVVEKMLTNVADALKSAEKARNLEKRCWKL